MGALLLPYSILSCRCRSHAYDCTGAACATPHTPEQLLVFAGILRSAQFIAHAIKDCLQEHALEIQASRNKPELFLAGHSLGGGAAALATAMVSHSQLVV
jgi:hypothetical protein